jgi:hypothetical protein
MNTYTVVWEVELDANSHREAAQEARSMQLDAYSEATFFDVTCLDAEGNEIEIGIDTLLEDEWHA